MRPTGRLALTAAGMAMIAAVLVLSQAGARRVDSLTDVGAAEPAELPSTLLGEATGAEPAETPARELVEPEPVAALHPELAHAFEFELCCTVLDSYGLPVPGAQFVFAPLGCSLNPWPAATGPDGTTVLRWRGKQSSMQMAVGVRAAGDRGPVLQLVEAHAALKQHVAFLAERPLPGKQLGQDGAIVQLIQAAEAQNNNAGCEFAAQQQDCQSCHAKPNALITATMLSVELGSLHPGARFVDPLLTQPTPEAVSPRSASTRDRFLAASLAQHGAGPEQDAARVLLVQNWLQTNARIQAVTATGTVFARTARAGEDVRSDGWRLAGMALGAKISGGSVAFVLRQPPASPTTGRIAGRVFGSDGRAVAGAAVVIMRDDMRPEQSTTTDATGAYSFNHVRPGNVQLRAGGRDEGLALQPAQVAAATTTPADLSLNRGRAIVGQVLGADGKPLRGWRVEFVATHEPWIDACETREDGRFVLPNLPGPGRLLLFAPDGPRLPAAVEPYVVPGAGDVCIDLRTRGEPKGVLLIPLRCSPGVGGAEARVWHLESGRGVTIQPEEDAFLLQGLATGSYRIEVGADGSGWRDLGTHWVDGKALTDLGVVDLDRPCHVSIVKPDGSGLPPSTRVELYRRRTDCDVRADGVKLALRDAILLPAGDWLVLWREDHGRLGVRTFACRAGESVEVPLASTRPATPPCNAAK